MLPVAACLTLPRIASRVPRHIKLYGNTGTDPLEALLIERVHHGLPLRLPQAKVHHTAQDVVMAQLTQWVPEAELKPRMLSMYADIAVDPFSPECGEEMGNGLLVDLPATVISIRKPVHKLECMVPGLGETVLAGLYGSYAAIPGPLTDRDLWSMFVDYRLEGEDTDVGAREALENMGWEEDAIPDMLPSVIEKEVGGKRFLEPRRTLKGAQLLAALRQAGVADAEELDVILRYKLPGQTARARKSLDKHPNSYWPVHNVGTWLTCTEIDRRDQHGALYAFADELYNDHMQCGDPDWTLVVNRVSVPSEEDVDRQQRRQATRKRVKPAHPQSADGLKTIALILRAWCTLDRALCILNNYEAF